MNSNFTIFIKILSGDIITTEFNKNETGIELRKRIQEIYPEFEWQRQVLIPQYHFHLDNDLLIDPITLFELQDLSKVQQGDILYLFVLDPFTEYIRYTGSITSTVSIFEVKHNSIDSFTFFSDNRYEKNNLFFYKNQLTQKVSFTLSEWFDTMPELIHSYNLWSSEIPHKKINEQSIRIFLHLWRIYN